jgi:putative N6-adenine-specific DNA methylase
MFDVNHGYLIEGVPADRGVEFMRSNDISKKVREALQDSFMKHLGKIPKVNLEEPKVVIVAFLQGGRCILSFDTAGKALHKRGYRGPGHPAPLKETLAASILMLAGYDGSQTLVDPMCGSGTIAIEAAMLALGKPPQIHRKKGQFLFEWLKDFDHKLWRVVQEEARGERRAAPPAAIYAADMSRSYVDMAQKNALKARVEKHITFKSAKFQDWEKPAETGLIVANLPYGERLERGDNQDKLVALYKEIGDTLKHKFSGWRAVLLAAEDSPYKFIGLKPKRKIPILNGSIRCKLLIFEMWEGGRAAAVTPRT